MTRKFRLWRCATLVWSCLYLVQAGPVERSVRVVREVYPEIEPEKVEGNQAQVCIVGDVVYGADEAVPADQSCLKCTCQPPGVHCETTRCEKKPGCRAIHKPNNCCPDYQCECEHEGKTYGNGERLETTPGGECKVCYCRGGEVQCAEVSCYIRTDCEGRTVPGQCCPKYEHCPPIEPTLDKIAIKPDTPETKPTIESTTRTFVDTTSTNNTSIENEISETTTSYRTQEATVNEKQHAADGFEATTASSSTIFDTNSPEVTKEDAQQPETDQHTRSGEPPKITIHEIIPEIKEIPMADPPKPEPSKTIQGQLLVEEAVPASDSASQETVIENANDLGLADSDLESSEVSEIFQHPPPVLRVGDQLLFLKKGEFVSDNDASTPSPVFTIIGAEGLQRGDVESVEHHEIVKEQAPSEDVPNENVEGVGESFTVLGDDSQITMITPKETNEQKEENTVAAEKETKEEQKGKETTKDSAEITLDNYENTKREVTVGNILVEEVTQVVEKSEETPNDQDKMGVEKASTESSLSSENATIDVAVQLATVELDTPAVTENPQSLEAKTSPILTTEKTDRILPHTQTTTRTNTDEEVVDEDVKAKSEEVVPLENPAYPPIPDIMSQQEVDEVPDTVEQTELELSKLKEFEEGASPTVVTSAATSRILPEILTIRNNHTIPDNVTNSEWLKIRNMEVQALVNEDAALPDYILRQVATSDEDTTTNDELTATISESNEIIEGKKSGEDTSSSTELPVENFNTDELLTFGTVISGDSLVQNQIKKLAEDDDNISGTFIQPQPAEETARSTETLEDTASQESGENTTPRNMPLGSLLTNEDASVETYQKDSEEHLHSSGRSERNASVRAEARESDVEMIEPHLLKANTTSHVTKRNVTHEEEEAKPSDSHLEKRTVNAKYDPESEKIFQELDDEIQLLSSGKGSAKMGEEEKKEAEVIFKELLDEVNSPSTELPKHQEGGAQARDRESAVLQRVSDAIAKFQLKDARQSLDTSILGILRDFFSSQYRSYRDK